MPSFLAREGAHIARARALRSLAAVALADPAARAAAYEAAGLAPVTAADDAEALRRETIYRPKAKQQAEAFG